MQLAVHLKVLMQSNEIFEQDFRDVGICKNHLFFWCQATKQFDNEVNVWLLQTKVNVFDPNNKEHISKTHKFTRRHYKAGWTRIAAVTSLNVQRDLTIDKRLTR